jgi:hypothetical protein
VDALWILPAAGCQEGAKRNPVKPFKEVSMSCM